jgi:hypothetical protein
MAGTRHMTSEAYARARTRQYNVKAGGLADVSSTTPVAREANTRRRIMHQYDVHALTCSQPLHLVVGIVASRVALKRCRFASVIGRPVTTAYTADTDCLAPYAFQVNLASVTEVYKSRAMSRAIPRSGAGEFARRAAPEVRYWISSPPVTESQSAPLVAR